MARSLPILAWLLAAYAGIVVVLINLASTIIQYHQHHFTTMFANSLSIVSLQINFTDASYATNLWTGQTNWMWDMYLNAECSGAQIEDAAAAEFRDCHKDTGKTFKLHEELLSLESYFFTQQTARAAYSNSFLSRYYATHVDSSTSSQVSLLTPAGSLTVRQAATIEPAATIISTQTPSSSITSPPATSLTALQTSTPAQATPSQSFVFVPTAVPTAASSHVAPITLNRIAPFVFYLIGLINAVVLWVLLPFTFSGNRHQNFLSTCIAASSTVALLIASAAAQAIANQTVAHLNSPESKPYVLYAHTGGTFRAFTWSTTAAMFLATILLATEWCEERFTPVGQRINYYWKPMGVTWFQRTRGAWKEPRDLPPELRQRQATRMSVLDVERARARQLELSREPGMGHLSNVERWMNRLEESDREDARSVNRPD